MRNLKNATTGALTALAIVIGFAGTSMAGPVRQAHPAMAIGYNGGVDQGLIIQVKNKDSQYFRDQRRDAFTKHNPNAAAIGQMLGGAKSIDLSGQGMAGVSPRHYAYCFLKYGSYRISDNSFVDFNGQRDQCASPYHSDEN